MSSIRDATEVLSEDERLVRDWLREREYAVEYEPRILASGKRADFLAVSETRTPGTIWIEVKSPEPDSAERAISKSWRTVKELGVPSGINGNASLHVNQQTREQSIRSLIRLFRQKAAGHVSENASLIFIQQNSDGRDIRHIEVKGSILEKVWVCGAGDALVAVPIGSIEDAFASTSEPGRGLELRPAFHFFDWNRQYDCALVVRMDSNSTPLKSIDVTSNWTSSLSDRIVSVLEEANRQLRDAHSVRPAPGIVVLMPAGHVTDHRTIAAGAYGKMTAIWDGNTGVIGELFYGRDGTFRRNKNRYISAIVWLRREAKPSVYFPNPYAIELIDETSSFFLGLVRAPVQFRYDTD